MENKRKGEKEKYTGLSGVENQISGVGTKNWKH